jgi:mitogen-activated protein kinase kinase
MQGLRLGASRPDFTGSASMPNSASPSMPGGRRPKPGLKLSGILGTTAGGAGGAGLAPGRPVDQAFPKRPPQGELGTPFANFRKIV